MVGSSAPWTPSHQRSWGYRSGGGSVSADRSTSPGSRQRGRSGGSSAACPATGKEARGTGTAGRSPVLPDSRGRRARGRGCQQAGLSRLGGCCFLSWQSMGTRLLKARALQPSEGHGLGVRAGHPSWDGWEYRPPERTPERSLHGPLRSRSCLRAGRHSGGVAPRERGRGGGVGSASWYTSEL